MALNEKGRERERVREREEARTIKGEIKFSFSQYVAYVVNGEENSMSKVNSSSSYLSSLSLSFSLSLSLSNSQKAHH